jgi:hypothetical protein
MASPLEMIDRLSGRVVNALHQIFGFSYNRNSEHYIYTANVATVASDAAGTIYNTGFTITAEADFVMLRMLGSARIRTTGCMVSQTHSGNAMTSIAATGDRPDFPYTVLVTDGASDRQLSRTPVDGYLFFGMGGGLPALAGKPRLIPRNSNISIQLVSLRAAPAAIIDIRMAFVGFKIYDRNLLDLTQLAEIGTARTA